jgi:hypothetical protein
MLVLATSLTMNGLSREAQSVCRMWPTLNRFGLALALLGLNFSSFPSNAFFKVSRFHPMRYKKDFQPVHV